MYAYDFDGIDPLVMTKEQVFCCLYDDYVLTIKKYGKEQINIDEKKLEMSEKIEKILNIFSLKERKLIDEAIAVGKNDRSYQDNNFITKYKKIMKDAAIYNCDMD